MASPLLNATIQALANREIEVSERGVRNAPEDEAAEAKRGYLMATKAVKAIIGSVIDSALVRAPRSKRLDIEALRANLAALPDIVDEATAEQALEGISEIVAFTYGVKGLASITSAIRVGSNVVQAAVALAARVASGGAQRATYSATATLASNFAILVSVAEGAVPEGGDAAAVIGVAQSTLDAAAQIGRGEGGDPNISGTLSTFADGLGITVLLAGTGNLATREAARGRSLASFALNIVAPEAARLGGLESSVLRLKGKVDGHDPAVLAKSVTQAEALLASVPRGDKYGPLRDTLEAAIASGKEALSTARPSMNARAAARQSALAARYAVFAGLDEEETQDLAREAILEAMGAG